MKTLLTAILALTLIPFASFAAEDAKKEHEHDHKHKHGHEHHSGEHHGGDMKEENVKK